MSHEPEDFRPVSLKVTCLHLRHKLMYVDERQNMPGMVDDESSTRIYFCTKTQEQLGPDDAPVGAKFCNPGRGCFCGLGGA
ncbi:MAG: hypothetical protein JSR77_10375 [Planctomycetes bacterium]|nr:hypothetical protein [Planctomycetota bacterium]